MSGPHPRDREIWSPAGAEIHVAVWPGDGTQRAILLVHGLASNARLWDGVARHLGAAGHPVAAVDLRGHGLSSRPEQGYDFATMCVDLDYVLSSLLEDEAEGWRTPVAVGQSYGANLVLEFAATRPWSLSGIACLDGGSIELSVPFPTWEACAEALAPPRFGDLSPEDLDGFLRRAHPDWPETGIQGTLANFFVNAEGFVEPCLSFDRHMAILHSLWEHRPSLLFPEMKVPVLLVPCRSPGSAGNITDKEREVEAALGALPRGRVQWFDADHDVHAQYPQEIADLLHLLVLEGFFT